MEPVRDATLGEKLREFAVENFYDLRQRILMSVVKAGHDQAAGVCTGLVQQKIDDLHSQVAAGGSLTKQDQHLLVKLTELKAEMGTELRASWENRGDWEQPEVA